MMSTVAEGREAVTCDFTIEGMDCHDEVALIRRKLDTVRSQLTTS